MTHDPKSPRSAYVHIPFCAHHCGYCDFAVSAGKDHLIELYLDALEMEIESIQESRCVDTIFIGGGTPTYLTPTQLRRLGATLNRWLPLTQSDRGARGSRANPESHSSRVCHVESTNPEFTIESTPDSVSAEKLEILCAAGLTRISIGVQTFSGRLLPALDRIHDPAQIESVLQLVRRFPLQISLDLIFGIPGQSLEDWRHDLDRAIELGIDHISTYGLTYEKGTPLWKDRDRGGVVPVPEESELAMYELAMDRFGEAGYEQYEISNFARFGARCRHNETYWANEGYFGFGVGAARYVAGVRELNVRNTEDYIRRVLSGESPTFQSEELSPLERARETMAVQLRRGSGINRESFLRQTSMPLDELIGSRLRNLVALGLLIDDGISVSLSRPGKCLADGVVTDLMKG